MLKCFLVGVGAAGNKAIMTCIDREVCKVEDTMMVNSTSKDFPTDYEGKKIILSSYDTGAGKERSVAKSYAVEAIKQGKFTVDEINKYQTVIVLTSVEGGTGSGSANLIAKFYNQVYGLNAHIIAFAGFQDDVRGLANTVEFMKEVDQNITVQIISNKSFLLEAGNNKFRAEELANVEAAERIKIINGSKFISGRHNIDDTDIAKVSNTVGYMTVEHAYLKRELTDTEECNQFEKQMIYNSKSIKSSNPAAARIAVITNVSDASKDAVSDYSFLKKTYGNPYEIFVQDQWDGEKPYIDIIVSGMKMPIDEIENIYNTYKEETEKVNKGADEFYGEIQNLALDEEDDKFNMIKNKKQGKSIDDFLSNI